MVTVRLVEEVTALSTTRVREAGRESFVWMVSVASRQSIPAEQPFSRFRVVLNMYSLSMEESDKFCLDSSVDSGSTWKEERCWNGKRDLTNRVWVDNEVRYC